MKQIKTNLFARQLGLTLVLGCAMLATGCHYLGVSTPQWLRPVVQLFRPAPTPSPLMPPRPLKPEKRMPAIPPYRTLFTLKSTSLHRIERLQIFLEVSPQTPTNRLKYIYRDLLKRHKHETDVIWAYVFRGNQVQKAAIELRPDSGPWLSRAEWFGSEVPDYLKFHIAKAHETYDGFAIEYRHPPRIH